VLDERRWGYGRTAVVSSPAGRFVLRLEQNAPRISEGDIVSFSGTAEGFERAGESRAFDEFLYWRVKGARAAVSSPEVKKIGVSRGMARWRALLKKRISATLPPRTAGYVLAAFTGARDPSLESLHRSVGTSHLLAVSGTHVAIVFGISWFFLKGFRHRLFLISLVIWLYSLLSGAAPSALRAALMIQLVIIGRMTGRSGKPFNTVSAAGAMMLMYNPWLFWDVGWRLSMLAVLSITSMSSFKISRDAKFFLVTPLVWLATTLQAAWTFESSPLIGIVANFFALPVFAVLFPVSFALSIPSLAGMPFGRPLAAIPEFLFARWERLSQNLLIFCPWELSFSIPLLAAGTAALTFLFASASGFERSRAYLAAAINIFGLCAILI
jgi:competence protein ComEC